MDREELIEKLEEASFTDEVTHSDVDMKKVRNRATNIRQKDNYVLFEVERHPSPDIVQTLRYHLGRRTLELACKFHAYSHIEQDGLGNPVCAYCRQQLDLYEEVSTFAWRCENCGAIGGKKTEIFEPSLGEPLIKEPAKWEKVDDKPVWIPTEND